MRPVALLIFALIAATICSARPVVVATDTILADLTRHVAGDTIEVRCLLPLEVDPHTYEPTSSDLRLLSSAALVVQNGLGLEVWSERLIVQSGYGGAVVAAALEAPFLLRLDEAHDHDHSGSHDDHGDEHEVDPHVWHDPRNVIHMAQRIATALVKLNPADETNIALRLQRLVTELKQLHDFAVRELGQLPAEQRAFATTHDSLAYLANAYNLRSIPIAGSRPDQEPSARELVEVVKTIRRAKARAIFIEATSSRKLAETLSRETGVKVFAGLYTDSLGPAGSGADTFTGMFRANVATLLQALR